MNKIDDGGPAFARGSEYANSQNGISIRDYFAACVLPTVLNNILVIEVAVKNSYIIADAMIRERMKDSEISAPPPPERPSWSVNIRTGENV